MHSPSPLVLGVAGVGLVFVWSAVHGANVSDTIRDLLAGHAPPAPATDPQLVMLGRAVPDASGDAATVGPSEVPPVGSSAAANRANGQLQAAARGWTGTQWTALDALWTRESNWSNTAQNPHSSAYGIAQFLDSTWAGVGGSKTSDPTLQIRYGLAYIAARYGTPTAAWAHETAQGWY